MWKGFVPGLLTAYAEKYLKDLARCYQHKLHKKVG